MQVGRFAAFGAVGVEVVADGEDAPWLGVVERLEPSGLLDGDRGDVLGDVRVDTLMQERHARGVPYQADSR